MIYHHSSIRSFLSHYAACASLIALTLWMILDIVFIRTLGVCGVHTAGKASASIMQCEVLKYHFNSALLKWFDAEYSWKAMLGRVFAVYDEARHNMAGLCGKTVGAAAKAAYCKKKEAVALGYAETVSLLLFYVWGPLVVFWLLLKRMFVRKVPNYAAN
jgi:hypothetical protein